MEHWAEPAKPTLREGVAETGEAQMSLERNRGPRLVGSKIAETICCRFLQAALSAWQARSSAFDSFPESLGPDSDLLAAKHAGGANQR